jgi:hypothetical protein
MVLTTYSHLVPELKMNNAVALVPLYACTAFYGKPLPLRWWIIWHSESLKIWTSILKILLEMFRQMLRCVCVLK